MAVKITIGEWASLHSRVLQTVRENVSWDMPIQQWQIVCEIAANPGIDGTTIRKRLNMTGGSLSRNLKVLGEYMHTDPKTGKKVKRGYNLIDVAIDPFETRARIYRLNKKGHKLMDTLYEGLIENCDSITENLSK